MVASEKSSLQAAVASGRLTAMVSGGFGGRRGFGFPDGPGGDGQRSPTPPSVT
jgi:hypothetical protein